ncbi:MAG: hypothetical protein KY476_14915 [Planctomycetes bacterium]|nr:hypothetical protein [Planctomycetota bacterium]
MQLPWRDPYWVADRPKHWPPRPELWREIIQRTGDKGVPARYSPDLSLTEIEQMEMACVLGAGIEFDSPEAHVRYFFQEFENSIGASAGSLVEHIYVEYHQSGPVHGRPISIEELRRKGADL